MIQWVYIAATVVLIVGAIIARSWEAAALWAGAYLLGGFVGWIIRWAARR